MPCAYCERSGILIYPVRYAVACPAGASLVPGLQDTFRVPAPLGDIAPAKFTLRRIRAGYLYTYDEKRRRLNAYEVGANGQMWKFDPGMGPPPSGHAEFQCIAPTQIVSSFCIDIAHSDKDPATNLWVGWSSVLWTPAMLAKVHMADWRKPHMRRVSITDMLAGQALHAASFATHRSGIADLALSDAHREKAFAFSNTAPQKRKAELCSLEEIAKVMQRHSAGNSGYIVAIDDPVGVTNDLSELVLPTDHAGFDEKLYRGKVVIELLGALKSQVKQKAASEVRLASTIAVDSAEDWRAARAHTLSLFLASLKSRNGEQGKKSNGRKQLNDNEKATIEGENQWLELITCEGKCVLDTERLTQFPAIYEKAAAAFQPVQQKLEQAHLRWLTSTHLFAWLAAVHDSKDLRSGFAYSESVAQCIGKSGAAKCCKDQLTTWLRLSAQGDTNNLYARALLFNQDELVAAVRPGLKGTDLQLDNMLSVYRAAAAALRRSEVEPAVFRITLVSAHVLVSSLQIDHGNGQALLTLAHLSLVLGEKLKSRAVDWYRYQTWLAGEGGVSMMSAAVESPQSGPRMGASTHPTALPAPAGQVVIFEAEVFVTEVHAKPSSLKIPGVERFKSWTSSNVPKATRAALVGSIVQLASLGFAFKDLAGNDRLTADETRTKAAISAANFGASLCEVMAQLATTEPKYALARYVQEQWAFVAVHHSKFAGLARWGGFAAGMAAAAYDLLNAKNAFRDKKDQLGMLYGFSGLLGGVIALGVFFSWPFMWPLMILSIAVNIAIGLLNSNAISDWLGKCFFSVRTSEKLKERATSQLDYVSLGEELEQYAKAMGA